MKIKYVGTNPTMLNGFVVYEGHTREVNDKQGNSLISEHPDQWVQVGGAAAEKPKEPAVPQPVPAVVKPVKKARKSKKK